MNKTIKIFKSTALIVIVVTAFAMPVSADNNAEKATLQAALMLKLLPYYENLKGKNFRIHCIGAPDVAVQLRTQLGKSFGQGTLRDVTDSTGMPDGHADIVFWGDGADLAAITNREGMLSISGNSSFVENGVTLGIVLQGNQRPQILLNLESSRTEGAEWKPAILEVVTTF